MPFFVYIISNDANNKLYKGFSENPKERLLHHNEGKSTYTSTYNNWRMVFLAEFPTKSAALCFEKKIKKWNRKSLANLIVSSINLINPGSGFESLVIP